MSKKLVIVIFISISLMYGFSAGRILQIQVKGIYNKVLRIYRNEYSRRDVLSSDIFYISEYCKGLVNKNEDIVVLEFNNESESEILRYYLYPKHIVYILNRVNSFDKPDPFIKAKNNIVNKIKSFNQLIQFMKSRNIKFLIIPNVKDKRYSFITDNQKYFKPIGYELKWGFFILN